MSDKVTTEQDFWDYVEDHSAFLDLEKSSFHKRLLVYQEGFAETTFFAQKKWLQEVIYALYHFEDFPDISVLVAASRASVSEDSEDREPRYFYTRIERTVLERELNFRFAEMDHDEEVKWTKFFNNRTIFSKKIIEQFANKYLPSYRYDNYEDIQV